MMNEARKQIGELNMSNHKLVKLKLFKASEFKDPIRKSEEPITIHDIHDLKMDLIDLEKGRATFTL